MNTIFELKKVMYYFPKVDIGYILIKVVFLKFLKVRFKRFNYLMVRMRGLEPPRLAAPDPKSGVYTNFTTSACDILTM